MHCFFRRWWSPTTKHPRQQPAPQYTRRPHQSCEGGPKQLQNSWLRRHFRSRGAMKRVRPRQIAFLISLRGWSTNYNYWFLLFLCFLYAIYYSYLLLLYIFLFIAIYYFMLFIIPIYYCYVSIYCYLLIYYSYLLLLYIFIFIAIY